MSDSISIEMKNHLGVLSENPKSHWTKEANVISWNHGPDKLDIREWSPDHEKMSKGVTLTADEARALRDMIDKALGGE